MDYLLMMAQGYQESRLDQAVKSPVGAIGVMQVMPATGKELKVGNLSELESKHCRIFDRQLTIDWQLAIRQSAINEAIVNRKSGNSGFHSTDGLIEQLVHIHSAVRLCTPA